LLSLAQWAALKDQQKRGGVNLNGAYFPRVRAEPSDALRQQTDPLEPAGRRFANFFFESSFSTVLFRDFPSDVGQQSDPQSDRPLAPPAGRRRHFLNSGWGLVRPPRHRIRWCGRRRRASAARYGVDFDTTPIETALNWGALALARAMGGSERSAEKGRRKS
jgi:hypothetical protein